MAILRNGSLFRRSESFIRPVSRLWFEISDSDAFDKCIKLCLEWMEAKPNRTALNPRSGIPLPPEAWAGIPFDITDTLGSNPTKASRIDAADGSVWAARLDFPDSEHPRTWVSEFFIERRRIGLVRFGAQLTCVVRGNCPEHQPTRQNLVPQILNKLSAEADGVELNQIIHPLEFEDCNILIDLLYDGNRRLPVLVISEDEYGRVLIQPNLAARHLSGTVHIFHLKPKISWLLTKEVGKKISVFNGAARLYLPGLTVENQNPFRHPLWVASASIIDQKLLEQVTNYVLPIGFLISSEGENFIRYSHIREVLSERISETLRTTSDIGQLQHAIKSLETTNAELAEDRNIWEGLARQEEEKIAVVSSHNEALRDENKSLKARVFHLESRLRSSETPTYDGNLVEEKLDSYERLEAWAEQNLGEHVIVHWLAVKDCQKNGNINMIEKIESALLIIKRYMVPFKLYGGVERRELAKT